MAESNQSAVGICGPIRWIGYNWDPRVVRFEDATGRRLEISLQGAVDEGMFGWETTTPERRDALLAWVGDPAMEYPPLFTVAGRQEARHG